jgi:hypothetical protein
MSSERELSPAEKRAQLKEELKAQFKREMLEDQAKLKQLQEQAVSNRRLTEVEQALQALENGPVDDSDVWISKLNTATTLNEIKLEMGLAKASAATEAPKSTESIDPSSRTIADEQSLPPNQAQQAANSTPSDVNKIPVTPKSLFDEEI